MIRWYTGQSRAGKTTAARAYIETRRPGGPAMVLLDGDAMREVWPGLGFTYEDRIEQNLRVARLALELTRQGFDVVVATIAPYRSLRSSIGRWLAEQGAPVAWVYMPGGVPVDEAHPYEPPEDAAGLTSETRYAPVEVR